jgi:type 1 fimbriae regulatory protein FimB
MSLARGAPMKSLTRDELLKILRLAEKNPRDHAIVLLAFRHGMRASEISNLELKDVDQKNWQITIRRLKGSLTTTQPLADVSGSLLLSERRVLRAWLKERGEHPSKHVFVSQKSGRISRSQLHRMFSDLTEQAGLPAGRRHFHMLKHTLGVTLVGANVNLANIKQALGHRSIASTAVYTQPTDEAAGRAVVSALASIF